MTGFWLTIAILQVLTMVIFALIVGLIYLRLDEKDVNVRTVVTDRYTHTHTLTHTPTPLATGCARFTSLVAAHI